MTSELLNLITLFFVVYLIHKISILESNMRNGEEKRLPFLSQEDRNSIATNKNKAIRELMAKYNISFDDARAMANKSDSESNRNF